MPPKNCIQILKFTSFGISPLAAFYVLQVVCSSLLRQQRILYPSIVWLISWGHAAYVPFLLIVVNFGALCLIGWFGGVYGLRQ